MMVAVAMVVVSFLLDHRPELDILRLEISHLCFEQGYPLVALPQVVICGLQVGLQGSVLALEVLVEGLQGSVLFPGDVEEVDPPATIRLAAIVSV